MRWTQLAHIDLVGAVLHAGSFLTLYLAMSISGFGHVWSDGSAIALWVIGSLNLCCYVIRRKFSTFTTPSRRAIPGKLF
jgi:hypothetical protein